MTINRYDGSKVATTSDCCIVTPAVLSLLRPLCPSCSELLDLPLSVEVVSLVVDHNECWEVNDVYLPNRLHTCGYSKYCLMTKIFHFYPKDDTRNCEILFLLSITERRVTVIFPLVACHSSLYCLSPRANTNTSVITALIAPPPTPLTCIKEDATTNTILV